jgi:hypothetical protein
MKKTPSRIVGNPRKLYIRPEKKQSPFLPDTAKTGLKNSGGNPQKRIEASGKNRYNENHQG